MMNDHRFRVTINMPLIVPCMPTKLEHNLNAVYSICIDVPTTERIRLRIETPGSRIILVVPNCGPSIRFNDGSITLLRSRARRAETIPKPRT